MVLSFRLSAGTAVCNNLDNELFDQFLNYSFVKAFGSDDEKQKVVESIQETDVFSRIDKPQLNLTVKTITYIIRRAMNFIMKPEVMAANLVDIAHFSKEKADLLVKFWMLKTKHILEGVNAGRELRDVQCELKAELASAAEQKSRTAIGVVRLQTADADKLDLELNHKELAELYSVLEGVQEELDVLRDSQS